MCLCYLYVYIKYIIYKCSLYIAQMLLYYCSLFQFSMTSCKILIYLTSCKVWKITAEEILLKSGQRSVFLSDSNEIRTHNHLVRKRTLSHLAKLFLDVQATIECRFTLKRVRDMIITYSYCELSRKYCFSPFVPIPSYNIFIGQRTGIRLFSHHFTMS